MGFRTRRTENTNFDSPQEMYKDNKRKKINGTLDYQSQMIDLYLEEALNKQDVALELPTGSGKTLIGLLIGEFRRRKFKEKIVYLCPNNQLVHQVVEKANNTFGIKVDGFTGSRANYSAEAKSNYTTAETIAITNYSSLFNTNSFFADADVIIFDDAHSSENYISKNWSLDISRKNNPTLYNSLVENLKDVLEDSQYNRMMNDSPLREDMEWFDKLPNIKYINKISDFTPVIDGYVADNDLRYPWSNLKNHLHACNMFLSWGSILIRPFIPPTLTHSPFSDAKQRIYMSATLGESGELERITGVNQIHRLPMVADWDKKSIERRFFLFPNASFSPEQDDEILLKINDLVKRTLVLVQDDKTVKSLKGFVEENTSTEVFLSSDIEDSKTNFVECDNAIAVLANRYDGIDMDGDSCNMLVLGNMPSATHIQEKFLTNRMAASVLFNERVKTRIIQAIGRCTRSDVDYAAVCIFGTNLENALISPKKIVNYQPELRAELEFGYSQSTKHENVESFIELLELFFEQEDDWEEAEKDIISLRDEYIAEGNTKKDEQSFEKLKEAAKHEVNYQYAMWKEDYEEALKEIELILSILSLEELKGYKGFWNYSAGLVTYQMYLSGKSSYRELSRNYFKEASKSTKTINWFNKLLETDEKEESTLNDESLIDVIERIEVQISKDGVRNTGKFETRVQEILRLLESDDGLKFEKGHQQLGELIGYISENATGDADPDPWWILNDRLCIVSEDKIYESEAKPIPVKHARQASTHESWIREKVTMLKRDAKIETVMITTSKVIDRAAVVHGKNVWYVNRDEFVSWAIKSIEFIRKIRRTYPGNGDLAWRAEVMQTMTEDQVTPQDLLSFIQQTRLSEI
ncbi:DEAD/DEAH box helicase family protein [Planococcus maritimus]|uniref:DEAD/DEAH box helicase family protein n=1 Tax=Planococcus maritimus TaxID=192421 RepID=UPI00232E0AFE|nr:DEAD/DEAH box helicase family protein [Planococcus maritimus]